MSFSLFLFFSFSLVGSNGRFPLHVRSVSVGPCPYGTFIGKIKLGIGIFIVLVRVIVLIFLALLSVVVVVIKVVVVVVKVVTELIRRRKCPNLE
jgi:hypothetical protein